jgi:hypothetical protein
MVLDRRKVYNSPAAKKFNITVPSNFQAVP